jgi:DNA mismatch repair ATPase MutS
LKIYEIDETENSLYYNHQLALYLKGNPGNEEIFFNHVYDIVISRIRHFKRQDPFSSKYASGLEQTRKLETFLDFLKTIDRWHKVEPLESVITEKDKLIDQLNERVAKLEAELKQAKEFDASEKVVITNGYIAAFMNLMEQFQNITSGNTKLLSSQGQSPWYKMIAKYFMHGDKPISIDTARNYFPARKNDKPSKYIEISEEDKLFKIVPKDKK